MANEEKIKTKKRKITPAIVVSAIALLISFLGVIYQSQQNILMHQQSELSVHGMLIERNSGLLELFLEHPEMRQYFYDNTPLPDDENLKGKALTLAELWTDFFEQVLIQLEHLPNEMSVTWIAYAKDMYATSPAIREYFEDSCDWYHESLVQAWSCQNVIKQKKTSDIQEQ